MTLDEKKLRHVRQSRQTDVAHRTIRDYEIQKRRNSPLVTANYQTTMHEKPKLKSKPPRGRPFIPGKSGNPSGRPKGWSEFRELCRERTLETVETLASIVAKGKRDADRIDAAVILLGYGWGKPAAAEPEPAEQTVNVIRLPMPMQSSEEWQRECDAWRARQALLNSPKPDALKANGNGTMHTRDLRAGTLTTAR